MSEEERPFLEELLDVAVYAPIGVLTSLVSEFPAHVARGRDQLERRVAAARVTGRFAVAVARQRVITAVTTPEPPDEEPTPEPLAQQMAHPGADAPRVEDLAIPGYDALAASQVVARLPGLRADERDAIRAYEEATRARRTILGRLAQLDEAE